MNVTLISSLPPIIGLSPYTKGLVCALSKSIQINFLGFNHIYPKFLYPGEVHDPSSIPPKESNHLKIRNVLNWYNPFGWIAEAFRIETDVVHAQWWSYPLAFVYLTILGICKMRGKRIIITIHNVTPHERSFIKNILNTSVFHFGDEYIVHTKSNEEALRRFVKDKPIHIIPHGIIAYPTKNFSREAARDQLGISQQDKILLCFGHIRDYKGLDVAIKALSLIEDKTVKLLIAGKCWEEWKKYQDIIDELDLNDRIISKVGFVPVEQTEIIFKSADLVVLPYKHFDSQSGVGALVLSFGIPLIVSNTGGLPDYVQEEVCVVEPDNENALAEKIKLLLSDHDLYQKCADNLSQTKNNFGWESIAERTINETYTK